MLHVSDSSVTAAVSTFCGRALRNDPSDNICPGLQPGAVIRGPVLNTKFIIFMNAAAAVGPQFGGWQLKTKVALKKRSNNNKNQSPVIRGPVQMIHRLDQLRSQEISVHQKSHHFLVQNPSLFNKESSFFRQLTRAIEFLSAQESQSGRFYCRFYCRSPAYSPTAPAFNTKFIILNTKRIISNKDSSFLIQIHHF